MEIFDKPSFVRCLKLYSINALHRCLRRIMDERLGPKQDGLVLGGHDEHPGSPGWIHYGGKLIARTTSTGTTRGFAPAVADGSMIRVIAIGAPKGKIYYSDLANAPA